ncbi:MAG TPA: hypothetical protein VFG54_21120 [Prolixibacteraceae bacterium]|nr:hypothetical protein [Prolixibacteraceae bacterium]
MHSKEGVERHPLFFGKKEYPIKKKPISPYSKNKNLRRKEGGYTQLIYCSSSCGGLPEFIVNQNNTAKDSGILPNYSPWLYVELSLH